MTLSRPGASPVAPPVVTDRGGEQTTYRSSSATGHGAEVTGGDGDLSAEQAAARRAAVARSATSRPAGPTVDGDMTRRTGSAVDPHPTAERPGDLSHDATAIRRDGTAPTVDTDGRASTDSRVDASRVDTDGRVDTDREVEARREPEVVVPVGPRPRASLLATLGLITGVAAVFFVLTGTLAGYGIALGVLAVVLSVLGTAATRRRHVAGKSDALVGILLGLGAVVLGVLAMTGQFAWPTTDGDWVLRFREWLDAQFVNRF